MKTITAEFTVRELKLIKQALALQAWMQSSVNATAEKRDLTEKIDHLELGARTGLLDCAAEDPQHPGLVCRLVHEQYAGRHYAAGYKW